jgi:predicted acetyltransferase
VRVTDEDLPVVEQIYRRYSERRTGQHVRSERWWKEAFFRRIYDTERKLADVAVWHGDDGDPSGYVCYESSRGPPPLGSSKIWLREFVALTGDAYQGLVRYILSHDLADEIFWFGPVDDPLAYAIDDSYQVKREYVDDMMLRVVDVEAAVAARPAGPGAPEGTAMIAISDAAAPWNQGAWRIECSARKLRARKVDGANADLSMEAATFAAVYDGFMKASDAVRSGLAEGSDAGAALLADRIFAPEYPPNGSDFF